MLVLEQTDRLSVFIAVNQIINLTRNWRSTLQVCNNVLYEGGIYARIKGLGFPYVVQRPFSSRQIYRIVANKNNIKRIGYVIFLMVTLHIIITRMHLYFSLPLVNRKANQIHHQFKILRDATYGAVNLLCVPFWKPYLLEKSRNEDIIWIRHNETTTLYIRT